MQAAHVEQTGEHEYRFSFDPCNETVRLDFNGLVIADSSRAMILRETRLSPVYYFPRRDVRMDLMERTSHRTHCPFKGNATYWTLRVADRVAENVMWSYEDAYDAGRHIEGYVAFYQERMDALYQDGERIFDRAPEISDNYDSNPFAGWLVDRSWRAGSPEELVAGLAQAMGAADVGLMRLRVVIRTLHPQLFSTGYNWTRDESRIGVRDIPYAMLSTSDYLDSPFYPIFEGAGGVRRRLDVEQPQMDFPVLQTLRTEGASDYVAMPLLFSNGQINVISIVSDRPGGFRTDELGHLYEILPVLSRLFEVFALHRTAGTLLDTYIGGHSGKKVLDGLVKRGDGEDLHAVIWFCDLRGSTPLADSLSREAFLGLLNEFFECTAGAVIDHGGEVLRFIGDAVLAIFPISHPKDKRDNGCSLTTRACERALAAVRDAEGRLGRLNDDRTRRDEPTLAYGVGLHLGDVTYGNIGTPERLEFTVIGAAANEAARIESMCKSLGKNVLISAEFAHCYPGQLRSLGRHRLSGVSGEREIFTLPDG